VDSSEHPVPGQQAPPPLPVPDKPVGGDRMGDCGMITPAGFKAPPETTAASWVLQDLDTGTVLAARDPHARERPASLIKTLLALVVVKQLQPDQMVTPTPEDAAQECTCVGLTAGVHYTVDQLLHALLMHSGNDAAHALATALGGVDVTVRKMNDTAASIGASDTRAATPSGLDGPGMSTSAYDLSLIFARGLQSPEFAQVVGTKDYLFPGAPGKPPIPIFNDNKLLGYYPGFLGGKTGFTDDARHTYVGGAAQGGKRLAVVMVRAEQRPSRVVDQAAQLLDWGFAASHGNAQPVGEMVKPTADATSSSGDSESGISTGGTTSASKAGNDQFGVTGWLVTLVVFVAIIAGFIVGIRRRRARQES
jgi:D-alanyl-D-alanine carboxypeptidase (penicillin-binding protein 5/6)